MTDVEREIDPNVQNEASFLNLSQVVAVSIGLQFLLAFFLGPLAVLYIAIGCGVVITILLRIRATQEPARLQMQPIPVKTLKN